MSLILDALRKLEDEKRGPGSQSTEPSLDAAGGRGRRRQTLVIGGIAIASAVVTAVVLSLLTSGGELGQTNDPNDVVSEPALTRGLPESTATLALADGDDELKLLPPMPKPEAEPEPLAETVVEAVSTPASTPLAPSETSAAEALTPEPEPETEDAPAAPFRVVGHEENAKLDSAPPFDADEVEEPPEPLTERVESGVATPSLILQGTSVIDGHPVAVISDQRVFEGDLIEGARVVRIGEREVELELEGKRFVLRL